MRSFTKLGAIALTLSMMILTSCGQGSGLSSTQSQSESPEDHAKYLDEFRASGEKFGLPVGLLESIAYVETRWHPADPGGVHESDDAHPRVYGIMGLHDDDVLGHSLAAAAAATGRTPEELKTSSQSNIEGAAALLAKFAKNRKITSKELNSWSEVVRDFSGITGVSESDEYVAEVYRILRDGVDENGIYIPSNGGVKLPEPKATDRPSLPPEDGVPSAGAYPKPPVTWAPSGNFTKAGIKPKYIVIHVTEGAFAGSVSWLRSPASKASAHYVIRSRDGAITQLVSDTDQAWHARCWNSQAIGIEHEGFVGRPEKYFTEEMYSSSAQLVQHLAAKFSIPKTNLYVVGHNIGDTALIRKTPLEDCNTHSDPGPGWNWLKYFDLLASR